MITLLDIPATLELKADGGISNVDGKLKNNLNLLLLSHYDKLVQKFGIIDEADDSSNIQEEEEEVEAKEEEGKDFSVKNIEKNQFLNIHIF